MKQNEKLETKTKTTNNKTILNFETTDRYEKTKRKTNNKKNKENKIKTITVRNHSKQNMQHTFLSIYIINDIQSNANFKSYLM